MQNQNTFTTATGSIVYIDSLHTLRTQKENKKLFPCTPELIDLLISNGSLH